MRIVANADYVMGRREDLRSPIQRTYGRLSHVDS